MPRATRRSTRLRGYDYSQPGAYFITVCTHNRRLLFGDVAEGEMRWNSPGQAVKDAWRALPEHYPNADLDVFVVMPNHVHGILTLSENPREGYKPSPTESHSISEIMRGFKTFSATRINQIRGTTGQPVWQRGFYEHVIRNELDLAAIREYIAYNPAKWADDKYNPGRC